MAYNAKEIWIPTSKQAQDIAASTLSSPKMVRVGGQSAADALPRGLCYGYHLKASTAHAGNSAVEVKLYDASGGDLLYSTTADLTGTDKTAVDTLATPIPFFDTPYFTIKTGAAGGTYTYTIRFFFKALA
tara:strand:- start:307 stop:696 length:390 start_codon:yes stop_codon:yes gene_type:complete